MRKHRRHFGENAEKMVAESSTPSATDLETRQYLRAWVSVGAGASSLGSEFILDYWAVPMHFSADQTNQWHLDAAAVVRSSEQAHVRLRRQGFASTSVSDHRATAYNNGGAAIEVILSRCRADGGEIECLATHFELALGPTGWGIVGIQTSSWPLRKRSSTADSAAVAAVGRFPRGTPHHGRR